MKVENIFYHSNKYALHNQFCFASLTFNKKTLSCCWFTKRGRKKLIPIHQYSTYNTTGCCIGKRGFSNTPFTVYVKYIRVVHTSLLHNFLPYHSWIDSMLLSRLENIETLQIYAKGGFFSESEIPFLDLQISKKNIPKNYPELEI